MLELYPLECIQLRSTGLYTVTGISSCMLNSYGKCSLWEHRADLKTSPGPFLEPLFVYRRAVLLLPACSIPFYFPFSYFSLYPLVDVPVFRTFCDLWVVLSSTCYFLVPSGTSCPFFERSGGAGEARAVVPSACRPASVLLTAQPSSQAQGI